MDEAGIAIGTVVPTSQNPFELIEPDEQTLNLPTPPVSAQCTAVLSSLSNTTAFMWRNYFKAFFGEPFIERIPVIGKISNKSLRSSQGDGFIERSFDKGDFMWASTSHVRGEWKTMSFIPLPRLVFPTLGPLFSPLERRRQ